MQSWLAGVGALYGGLAVLLGAFGAHGLKSRLDEDLLTSFETGVRYQFYHALALLLCAAMAPTLKPGLLKGAGACFVTGTFLFSGSIYLLATRQMLPFGSLRFLGPVTPVGGVLLIVGWCLLAAAAWGLQR